MDAVRVDAEPLQPDLSRRGAGDDPPLSRSGCRADPVEPTSAREAGACAGSQGDEALANRPVRQDALWSDADKHVLDAVDAIARKRKLPHAQIALAWLLKNDDVTAPIIGATKMEHLEAAVGAVDVELSEEEVAALEQAYVPHPVAGFS